MQQHTFQPFTGSSPISTLSPSNGYTVPQNHIVKGNFREDLYPGSHRPIKSLQPYSENLKTPLVEFTNGRPGEDDLNALDIPDMPPSSTTLTDEIILTGRASFHLIKRPLPSNFIVADAIAPFESSSVDDLGRCESKYWATGVLSKLYQHVRDTSDWDDLLNDPIFLSIPDESEFIPVEDLTSLYNQTHCDGGNEELGERLREVAEDVKSPQDGEDTGDVMDSLEHALSEGRRKQPDANCTTTNTPKELAKPRTDTEEVLASLGVTGAPKPVRAPARPYPPPSLEQQGRATSDHRSWSSSRSPSRYGMLAVHFCSLFGLFLTQIIGKLHTTDPLNLTTESKVNITTVKEVMC